MSYKSWFDACKLLNISDINKIIGSLKKLPIQFLKNLYL